MDFTIDDLMRHAYVMVTSDDEYCLFARRMWYAGFDRIPTKYVGLYPKVLFDGGFYGCSLTHFNLVNMARTLNLDHITIFESDAYPMRDCRTNLARFLSKGGVPDDADELVFGNLHFIRDWTNRGRGRKCLVDVDDQQRFGRIKDDLWGAHAVVIFRKAYDTWINNYLKQEKQIGADFFKWLTPNCYATTRSFFLQVKDKLQYPDMLVDKEWLEDFPEIGKVDLPVAL